MSFLSVGIATELMEPSQLQKAQSDIMVAMMDNSSVGIFVYLVVRVGFFVFVCFGLAVF